MPRIITSPFPAQNLPSCSVFSFVFPTPDRFQDSHPAFIDAATGTVLTRGHLRATALELAYGMTRGPLFLRPGGVIGLFMPNSLAFTLCFFGAIAAGCKVTPANSSYTPRELAHQLRDSQAQVVFVHSALLPVLEKTWKELGVKEKEARLRTVVVDWMPGEKFKSYPGWKTLHELLGRGALNHEVLFDGERAHETALICYSSGTTGLPKGVETTHHNLTSVITCARPPFGILDNEVLLGVLPFYHIFAACKLLLYFPAFGAPVVVLPAYTPDAFCAAIERYHITTALVVPPILLALAKHPSTDQHDLRSLQRLYSGAAPLSASLVYAVRERLAKRGVDVAIGQGYGLTETSPTIAFVPTRDASRKIGTTGPLLPNIEARLVTEDGGDARPGEPGELWVRGPIVMKGYLRNPRATHAAITPDGFFKTGDVAIIDDEGFLTIVDRSKELIKFKGFQVPPAELEAVLVTHPEIADAAVIGMYSAEQATELPRAYVVPSAGLQSFKSAEKRAEWEKEIQSWAARQVARHKQLRGGVVAVDSIPRSAAGKILRRELRERCKQETGRDPRTGLPVTAGKAPSKL